MQELESLINKYEELSSTISFKAPRFNSEESLIEEFVSDLKELKKTDMKQIKINGEVLNEKETVIIKELIYGALQYGVQSEGYLEDTEHISKDEQVAILENFHSQFYKN